MQQIWYQKSVHNFVETGESGFSWAVMVVVLVAVGGLGVSVKMAFKTEFKEKYSHGIQRKKAF